MIADFIKKDIIELYNDLDNTKSTVKQVRIYEEINEKLSQVIHDQYLDILKYKSYYNNAMEYRKDYYQRNKGKIQETSRTQYLKKKEEQQNIKSE